MVFSRLLFLQNRFIVDVRLDSKYLCDVLPLPLTTTMRTTSFPQAEDIRLVLKFSKSKSNTIVTNFQFWHWQYSIHVCPCLPSSLTTATITTSFFTRTCNYEFLWHFTKELVRKKHAVEELPAINRLQFWFVGIKNIEANVYEVVSSQQVSFNCWGCRS